MENNQQRQFDWGPPVKSGDSFTEWVVYLLIIAILSAGTWFLLDITRKKRQKANEKPTAGIVAVDEKLEKVVPAGYEEAKVAPVLATAPEEKNIVAKASKGFFVQIGAFGDEASAKEIVELLKKEAVESTLLKPDEQFEIYRLVVGPFPTEKIAEDKAEQLNAIDFPCFVVEAQ